MTPSFSRHPVDNPRITGGFGADYGYKHRGVDYGAVEGTPIYAPADGVSCNFYNGQTTWKGQQVLSFGLAVCLDHGDTFGQYRYTLYAHMSRRVTEEGDAVKAGDILGYVGHSGVADGNHLHWQLCDSVYFPVDISHSADPIPYITEVEDLTKEETLALIKELQDNGDLASTTDVLSCVAQIAGAEELTYTDTKRIEATRLALGDLKGTPVKAEPVASATATTKEKSSK